MNTTEVQTVASLSQWQRLASVFSAPARTFDSIKQGNRSWWLPLIVISLASYLLFAVVSSKVGMPTVVENQIRLSGHQEQMDKLTPEQRAQNVKISTAITNGVFIASPVMTMIYALVISLVLMVTINVGFGGKASFGSVLAVWFYAFLPGIVKVLLGTAALYADTAPELFNIKNFAPTNVGAFLNPLETNKAVYALASSVDLISIWCMVLMGIGLATVAGVKRKDGYLAVFGWWVVVVLVSVGFAAIVG